MREPLKSAANLVRSSGGVRARVAPASAFHRARLVYSEATPVNKSPTQPAHSEPTHHTLRRQQYPAFRTDMSTGHVLERFLATNSAWAQAVAEKQPSFFETLAESQQPKMLWLGCADSRVPESVVLAVKPGEVFVHRNIAK
jgi:hypothetical protein